MPAPVVGLLGRLTGAFKKLPVSLKGLGGNLDLAAGAMSTLTDAMLQANQIAMGANKIGISLNEINQRTIGQGIVGVAKAEAQAGAITAGLRGNTFQINRLFTRMKLTGQDMGLMLGTMRSLDITTGMSIEQLEGVALEARELGASFGISSEKIIGAIASMGKVVERVGLISMGTNKEATGAFTKALMQVTTLLGPGMESRLKESMELLTDGSQRGLVRSSQLGIASMRNMLSEQDVTAQDLIKILRTAGGASTALKNSMTGAGDKLFGLQRSMDILGSNSIGSLIQVNQELSEVMAAGKLEETLEANKRMDQMTVTLGELGERFLSPMRDLWLQIGPIILTIGKVIAMIWSAIMGIINTALKIANLVFIPILTALNNMLNWTGLFDSMTDSLGSMDDKTVDQRDPLPQVDIRQTLSSMLGNLVGADILKQTLVHSKVIAAGGDVEKDVFEITRRELAEMIVGGLSARTVVPAHIGAIPWWQGGGLSNV